MNTYGIIHTATIGHGNGVAHASVQYLRGHASASAIMFTVDHEERIPSGECDIDEVCNAVETRAIDIVRKRALVEYGDDEPRLQSEIDDEIASCIEAREIEAIEADIRHFFGKLGAVSRTNDPKGGVCGWHVVNGRIPILREDLPVDCNLETESECHREHRRSILETIKAAYDAGRAGAPQGRLLEVASAVIDSASTTYRKRNGHIGSIEDDDRIGALEHALRRVRAIMPRTFGFEEEADYIDRIVSTALNEKKADPLADLVSRFSLALLDKLRAAEAKYGRSDDWLDSDWQISLQCQLAEHVAKGDPLDVAAYAAFAWHHGWPTSQLGTPTILATGAQVDAAVAYGRDSGAGWNTSGERVAAELGARRAISHLAGEVYAEEVVS